MSKRSVGDFMVYLKNITIGDSIAEADYSPEGSNVYGHIVIDLNLKKIIRYDDVLDYGMGYPAHALQKIIRMYEKHETYTECLVMWY
jgi:hypothetical protein